MTRRRAPLVRYVSPFGSPAWMSRETAAEHLRHDDDRWLRAQQIETETGSPVLSAEQRRVGPPRIETGR